jgi:hypothetical protein
VFSVKNIVLKPMRWGRRAVRRNKSARIYKRYRDATMIPRCAFVDNLELARMIAGNRNLATHSVVECGTWRGGMSAGLIEILGRERPYHFFDSFAGLPPAKKIDGEKARRWQANTDSPQYYNNCTASRDEFMATIYRTRINLKNVHLHQGLFSETVEAVDVGTVALLRLDGDWYDSTMCCLQAFFPKIVSGGYVIIDDYGTWDGCTRAVHDYLSQNKHAEPIRRYGLSDVPYIEVS